MADIKVFGHKISPTMAVIFAGGSGIAIWFAWKQHQSSAGTSASAIDPVTGLPYSQDNETDPLTGESYLAEAQQYGSVSAAENAVAGESSIDYSAAGSGGGGLVGSSTGSLVPANEVQGTAYATNAAWAQAVEAGLTDIGYSSTDVAAALGRYLGGLSETSAQATIVQAAVAEYGTPPVGSFQIIQAPPTTGTGTGTGTGTATSFTAKPAGLQIVFRNKNGVELKWNPVTQNGVTAKEYRLQTYQSGKGGVIKDFTTANTIGNVGGLTPGASYTTHVWAVPAAANSDYSSISYTLPKS
jgi:hypothetical protein